MRVPSSENVSMEQPHIPVMLREVVAALQVKSAGLYIDCTVGAGGHSEAILQATEPSPRLLGIDLDSEALELSAARLADFGDKAVLEQGNFSEIAKVAAQNGFAQADGILFDLGISSMQVDRGARGFSFQQEAPLDMRFDPNQRISAFDIVNEHREDELADLIFNLGEERRSRRIARAIVRSRPIATTTQLADVVAAATGGRRGRIHPATRTFQAIRIAVNGELDNLLQGMEQTLGILRQGGRLAIISYHSLEDRIVKNWMRQESRDCVCPPEIIKCECGHIAALKLINRRVITPSQDEIEANPRSRSAKLRIAERV